MTPLQLFVLHVGFSFVFYTLIAKWYIWPRVRTLPLEHAVAPFLILHGFRLLGLLSINPIVVDPRITETTFAIHQAYGDLAAAILAVIALTALQKQWKFRIPLLWIFSIVGTIDLLEAMYNGIASEIYTFNMNTFWLIPTFVVPALLVTHVIMYMLLFRERNQTRQFVRATTDRPA